MCSGIAIAESTTRSASYGARPCSSNVVIGSNDDSVRVVRVYCDARLVLCGCERVLVDCHVRSRDGCAVEVAIEDVRWGYGGVWWRGCWLGRFAPLRPGGGCEG